MINIEEKNTRPQCVKMKPFCPFLSQTLKDIFIFLDRIKGILTQKFLQGIFKTFLVR
jgi:hypothetical protein